VLMLHARLSPCVSLSESAVLLVGTVFAVENPPPGNGGLGGAQDSEIDTHGIAHRPDQVPQSRSV
jgi:hypothetical protein